MISGYVYKDGRVRKLVRAYKKTERFSDVVHELRSPLSVIQGTAQGFLDGVIPADPEHAAVIRDEAALLGKLITDLRDLALAEVGELRLERKPADVTELVRQAVAGLLPRAEDVEPGRLPGGERPASRRRSATVRTISSRRSRRPTGRRASGTSPTSSRRPARALGRGHGRGDRPRPPAPRLRALLSRRCGAGARRGHRSGAGHRQAASGGAGRRGDGRERAGAGLAVYGDLSRRLMLTLSTLYR